VPNRRRRKLSTAMSAVAALAVASPCAYFLVYESTDANKPPQHHEFKQAAVITDLPNELISALTQGLSQFGINLPSVPALTGTGTTSPGLTSPGLTSPGLGTPSLGSPSLGSPSLGSPSLGSPSLTSPGLTSPGLTSPGLTSPGLTPGAMTPGTSGLTTPSTALTPLPGAGVTTPNPALTSPAGVVPGMGDPTAPPGEVPIAAPIGLDPGADGTYPILGDPSGLGGGGLGQTAPAGSTGGGGLINDLMQAANQLGAGQAIDLLKGLVMPAIMQGVQHGGAATPATGVPGAALPTGGLPGAALPTGALPGATAPTGGVLTAGVPGAALPTGGLPTGGLPTGGVPAAAVQPVAPPMT
jgi:hypothetical protein